MNILQELKWRGLIKAVTNEAKVLNAQEKHYGVYCGFDPTADSLHVGHLVLITALKRFHDFGFKAIALIGGGTGKIGDPSFKATERPLLDDEIINKNVSGIESQLKRLISGIDFDNNINWIGSMTAVDFLRDVGKDFNISYLLNKESIATRINTGLSFTEFSYTMVQAFDFFKLYETKNCKIQIGGSDQWGNITSGTDYISSKLGSDKSEAAGVTMQLLLKSDGTKFGKTATGAIWLDESKTSVYSFYQFWLNQTDADVVTMLKFFTFLTEEEINKLQVLHGQNPKIRIMQSTLADEITLFVHGTSKLQEAKKLTEAFFKGDILNLSDELIEKAIKSLNWIHVEKNSFLIDAIIKVEAASSKREAKEFIAAGAISCNNTYLTNENMKVSDLQPILGNKIIVKRGKKNYYVLVIK